MRDQSKEGREEGAERGTANGSEERREMGTEASVSRRNALKVLGSVPVVAAIGGPLAAAELSAQQAVPTKAAQAAAPKFFTTHEWQTVRVLVDYIIPRDERSGSATDAKVPEYIDYLLAEKDANVNTQVAMRGGLGWLDNECRRRFQKTFISASDAQRREVLDDIAYPSKAKPGMSYGVTFFNRMRDMTASGFFSSQIGWQDLQYKGGVADPKYDGCPPAVLQRLGVSYDVMQNRVNPEPK